MLVFSWLPNKRKIIESLITAVRRENNVKFIIPPIEAALGKTLALANYFFLFDAKVIVEEVEVGGSREASSIFFTVYAAYNVLHTEIPLQYLQSTRPQK